MKKIIITRFFLNSIFALILMSSALIFPSSTSAQGTTLKLGLTLDNPLGGTDTLTAFVENVLTGLVELLTPVIVIMFVWTGFLFIKARDNGEELGKAKDALMYTIIGAALVLGAEGLSKVLSATLADL